MRFKNDKVYSDQEIILSNMMAMQYWNKVFDVLRCKHDWDASFHVFGGGEVNKEKICLIY